MTVAPSLNEDAATARTARILILSASTGNGHMSAMAALEHEFQRRGVPVRGIDTLDYTGKAFKAWYAGGYERVVRTKPEAWGHLYEISDHPKLAFHFQGLLDFTFVSRARRLLETYRPTVVVCTHSLPQPFLAHMRKTLGFKIAVVVTDLYPHLMWLRGKPDLYLLPSEWSQEVLEERMPMLRGRSVVTGIPVHEAFARSVSRAEARAEIGLHPELPTCTVTAGGIGAGPVLDVCRQLARQCHEVQAVVVAGRNRALYERLEKEVPRMAADSRARFHLNGSVALEQMARFMKASDFLIGKSGGLTTSEALASECGFVVYEPLLIPGQEFENARFLEECGAGLIAKSPEQLGTVLERLLGDPDARERMRERARAHGRPNSTRAAVDAILAL